MAVTPTTHDSGEDGPAGAGRVRRSHTRSRNGCLTCRKRHVRCDEGRPNCIKCISSKKECEYPLSFVPLRERRQQERDSVPGQQHPWAAFVAPSMDSSAIMAHTSSQNPSIPWHLDSSLIDPFGMLPIKMAFRSRELLHYFHQAGDSLNLVSNKRKEDCLERAILDPYALRNSLLLAGLHYAWFCSGFQQYESTFFFHKVETIRMINTAIASQGSRSVNHIACARQIATLCFVEASLHDASSAEAHLHGLTSYLDLRDRYYDESLPRNEVEEELLDRYLLITYSFLHTMNSSAIEFPHMPIPTAEQEKKDPEAVQKLIKIRRNQERMGLDAFRLFPFFFSQQPNGRKPRDIDVYTVIRCLRPIADYVEKKELNMLVAVFGSTSLDIWTGREPAELLLRSAETLEKSLSLDPEVKGPKADGSPRIMSSWSGCVGVVSVFLNSVCSIANDGQPINIQLHRRILSILQRDIQKSELVMRAKPGLDRSLWFWKVFIAALSLALRLEEPGVKHHISRETFELNNNSSRLGVEAILDVMRQYYEGCVQKWIGITGVSRWEQAEETLAQIVWPKSFPNKPVAEGLWRRLCRP